MSILQEMKMEADRAKLSVALDLVIRQGKTPQEAIEIVSEMDRAISSAVEKMVDEILPHIEEECTETP